MANPNPLPPPEETRWKPGQSGNPDGRPKGSRSLSTIIRKIAEDMDSWDKMPVKNKDTLKEMGAPIEAVAIVAFGQAITGDSQAREWLRKAGYGDDLNIQVNDNIKDILNKYGGNKGDVTELGEAEE